LNFTKQINNDQKKLEKKFSDFKVMKYLKVKVLKFLKNFLVYLTSVGLNFLMEFECKMKRRA